MGRAFCFTPRVCLPLGSARGVLVGRVPSCSNLSLVGFQLLYCMVSFTILVILRYCSFWLPGVNRQATKVVCWVAKELAGPGREVAGGADWAASQMEDRELGGPGARGCGRPVWTGTSRTGQARQAGQTRTTWAPGIGQLLETRLAGDRQAWQAESQVLSLLTFIYVAIQIG